MEILLHVASTGRADLLLLKELQKTAPELSRAKLKSFFQNAQILFNERPLSAAHSLEPGSYPIQIRDWQPASGLRPSALFEGEMPLVVFEDEELLAFEKPSGMPSVPHDTIETGSAVNAALKYLQGQAQYESFLGIGQKTERPLEAGILHRLDTGTSGVLLFAKTLTEFERLKQAWKTRAVRKFYRAIVHHSVDAAKLAGTVISTPIAHDAKSSKKMVSLPSHSRIRGNPLEARTRLLSIEPYLKTSYLEIQVEIETGVMHQIRVHLASVGLPILGDNIYGNKSDLTSRLMLHHERLDIPLKSGSVKMLKNEPNWAHFLP